VSTQPGIIKTNFRASNHKKSPFTPTQHNDIVIHDGDFTSFGILPFFQERLNHLLGDNTSKYPDKNVNPTSDQRNLLSVLLANYSIIHQGRIQSGKTLALIIYALNLSLSRTPNYKYLTPQGQGSDSVIIVPTDELVDKYKTVMESLLVGIPENCCPGTLTLENKESMRSYSLTRVPLTVNFLYSSKPHSQLSTSHNPTPKSNPQIIVTTLSNFTKLGIGKSTSNSCNLANLKFMAVDDFDIFIKATNVNSETLVEKRGPKGKYINILEEQIKKLQLVHMESFARLTDQRLKRLQQQAKGDPKLEQKLQKEKRRVLYKPIQYCFITKPEHPYKQMLNVKTNAESMKNLHMSINYQSGVKVESSFHQKLNQNYTQYLIDKSSQISHKVEDPQTAFIERITRFNDDQRVYKKSERQLINVGSFENSFANKINAYFTMGIANNYNLNDIIIKDLSWKIKGPSKVHKVMDHHIELSRKNVKNLEKAYLKFKMLLNNPKLTTFNSANLIDGAVTNFKKTTKGKELVVIVVPSYCNVSAIVKKLNKINEKKLIDKNECSTTQKYKVYTSKSELDDETNFVLTVSQLTGQEVKGMTNMMVLGIDSLLYETAYTSGIGIKGQQSTSNSDSVTGIVDPVGNLLYYYLSKLNTSSTSMKERNFIFVADGITEKKYPQHARFLQQDLKKLSELIIYNGVPEALNIKKFSDLPQLRARIPIGVDQEFVNIINKELHRTNSTEN
jgi:hypothetical protein